MSLGGANEGQKKYWFLFIPLGYLLTPNPETRPDIYQASYLTFKLKNPSEKCPVQNLNVSTSIYLQFHYSAVNFINF